MSAQIEKRCLILSPTTNEDPYYQIFRTNTNSLNDTLSSILCPGDTVTISFDYLKKSGISASMRWYVYDDGWNGTNVSIPVSESKFSRMSTTYTIPGIATGFMFRFIITTIGGELNIKNIVLTKGNLATYYIPHVPRNQNGIYVTDTSWLPTDTGLALGESCNIVFHANVAVALFGSGYTTCAGTMHQAGNGTFYFNLITGSASTAGGKFIAVRWTESTGYTASYVLATN